MKARLFASALIGTLSLAIASPSMAKTAPSLSAKAQAFLETVFNQHKVNEAFDRYVGPTYTQHNPNVPDGREASTAALNWMVSNFPDFKYSVKRTIAQGDLVVVHSEVTMKAGDPKQAVVDIFRFKNGKIVEHWDVIQPVPAESKNSNGMF